MLNILEIVITVLILVTFETIAEDFCVDYYESFDTALTRIVENSSNHYLKRNQNLDIHNKSQDTEEIGFGFSNQILLLNNMFFTKSLGQNKSKTFCIYIVMFCSNLIYFLINT